MPYLDWSLIFVFGSWALVSMSPMYCMLCSGLDHIVNRPTQCAIIKLYLAFYFIFYYKLHKTLKIKLIMMKKNHLCWTLLIVLTNRKLYLGCTWGCFSKYGFYLYDLTLICYSLAALALLLLSDAERYSRLSSDDSSHD